LTPVSQLKVPLPNFPLSHEDGEDDVQLLARVKQEARNIMGGYTRSEHEGYVASLRNNGRLNHVLEVAGVAYGPRSVPVSVEVLKKRKADASTKVSAKCLKVTERKGAGLAKVSRSRASGCSKQPSGVDVPPAKSVKLSKDTKAGVKRPDCKTVFGAKAAPSAKKRIVLAIEVLAALCSEGTEESSPHDQAPEVQSKANPRGPLAKPQARCTTTSGPRPAPEVSLPITPFDRDP
jgi:hypothetical protein